MNGVEGFFRHVGIREGAVAEGFHIAIDDGERGAEFVGDIGDEFAAHGLERSHGGDVLKDQENRTGRGFVFGGDGGDMDAESAGLAGGAGVEQEFEVGGVASAKGQLHGVLQFVAAENLQHGAIEEFFDLGKNALERGVAKRGAHAAVHEKNALTHSGEDRAQAQAFLDNLTIQLLEQAGDFSNVAGGFEIRRVVGCKGW